MKLIKQFKRYSIVGACSTLINYFFYYLTFKIFGLIVIASFIGYFMGLLNSYFFGKKWVFNSNKSHNLKTISKFLIIYFIGALLNALTIYFLSKLSLNYYICWIIGTFFATLNNFYGSKKLVFNDQKK